MSRKTALALIASLFIFGCGEDPAPPDDSPVTLADAVPEVAPAPADPAPPGVPDEGWTDGEGRLPEVADTFSIAVPGGYDQQLPDQALAGNDAMHPRDAIAAAVAALNTRPDILGEGVVLVAGMDHHGTPIVPEDKNPANLDPTAPAFVADPDALDPATTYADCLGLLQACSMASTTMDGCVNEAPVCTKDKPWEAREHCCPSGALEAYRAQRDAGVPWTEAYLNGLINGIDYFPGLRALYTEGGL